MITLYAFEKEKLCIVTQDVVAAGKARMVWVDLLNPSEEEEAWVESLLQIDVPTRAEMNEIELSNRFYQENGALYVTATVVTGADTGVLETHAITCVLVGNCLVTVRYSTPSFFTVAADRMLKGGIDPSRGSVILSVLLETVVNRIADVLEGVGHRIDQITRNIFAPASQDLATGNTQLDFSVTLRQIGASGDLISRMRESLISLARLHSFLSTSSYYSAASAEHVRMETLRHDIPALSDHAGFLSNKISFLLDATLGMVNIQQNTIIKIFSVVSVVFLPPTLVASIYGMNFDFMPELHWPLGYPMAVLFMVMSAFLPYLFFRKKGWL